MKEEESRSIQIERRLRPIRLAFLVDLNDKKNLRKIFEINTCLWGGMYNGIIPSIKRIPSWWDDNRFKQLRAKDAILGYIDAFEPDYLVCTNDNQIESVEFVKERKIKLEDLLDSTVDTHVRYGIRATSIYRELYDSNFKFIQRHPPKVLFPENSDDLLISSLFGCFPKDKKFAYFEKMYTDVFDAKSEKISGDNLHEAYLKWHIDPLRASSSLLDIYMNNWSRREPLLYLFNKNKVIDLIDLWNLRALGRKVVPVPIQWANDLVDSCKEIIKKNHVPLKGNPNGIMHETTLMKSRSIEKNEFDNFWNQIKSKGLVGCHWYPRIWSGWARKSDNAIRCTVTHKEDDIECTVKDGRIHFSKLKPDFEFKNFSGTPGFTNVFKLRDYGSLYEYGLVFPPRFQHIDRLLKAHSYWKQLYSSSEGVVNLVEYKGVQNHWEIPRGLTIFNTWLEEKGFTSELSDAGKVALQMMLSLEGSWGCRSISHPEIIKLLNNMAQGLVDSIEEEKQKKNKRPITNSRMAPRDRWISVLNKVHKNEKRLVENNLNSLIEYGALKLGLKLKCDSCDQNNWFSVDDLDYRLSCSRCLQKFSFPTANPPKNKNWCYSTQGAFSVENYARGSYCVVLAIRFLSSTMESSTTWVPSMKLKNQKGVDLEFDFGMWRRSNRSRENETNLVFGECKSFFDKFESKDIRRMKGLAQQFPGSTLVFCTFRNELTPGEINQISKLVRWGWESIGEENIRARVLILTGVELFNNDGPPLCWRDAGGKFSKFEKTYRNYGNNFKELCDATQKLYLGMESYWDWFEEKRKKAARKAKQMD